MESSVKKLLIPLLLGLAFAGNVEAAPPTPAQIDRLLQVMDAQKVIDQMQTRQELYDMIGYHDYEALDASIVKTVVPQGMPQRD